MVTAEHDFSDDLPADEQPEEPTRESGLVKKTAIGVVGGTVTAAGVAMLFLPGPGIATIIGGLAILGTEFPAAKQGLDKLKDRVRARTTSKADH